MGVPKTDSRQIRLGRYVLAELQKNEGKPVETRAIRAALDIPKKVDVGEIVREYFNGVLSIERRAVMLREGCDIEDLERTINILNIPKQRNWPEGGTIPRASFVNRGRRL